MESELLQELNQIRLTDDKGRILQIIEILVEKGVYSHTPHTQALENPFVSMVTWYGAYWHLYKGVQKCPLCGVDLCDHQFGPPFKREILQKYDNGGSICPDCKGGFNRMG